MKERLNKLFSKLNEMGLCNYSSKVRRIMKLSSMPGVDVPADEIDVDGIDNALKYIEENSGKFIYLDNPKGSEKRFGQKTYKVMPFHYGEFTEVNNPSDDMGWDIIVVPSDERDIGVVNDVHHIRGGHNLIAVGYVPVNDDDAEWKAQTRTAENPEGKPAPKGNDKIILAPNGKYTESDKADIEGFFDNMWNFNEVVWL